VILNLDSSHLNIARTTVHHLYSAFTFNVAVTKIMFMFYKLPSVSLIVELPYGWERVEDPHYGVYYIE